MQTDTKIAKLYVDALLKLDIERSLLEDLYLQLKVSSVVLLKDGYIREFFSSPIIPWQKKVELIEKVFAGKIHKYLFSFLAALIKRNRFVELPAIERLFRERINQYLGQRAVLLSSARDLGDIQERSIGLLLKGHFDKNIIFRKSLKKDLMGGFEIKSGDFVIDASMKKQLEIVKKTLLEKKISGEQYYEN